MSEAKSMNQRLRVRGNRTVNYNALNHALYLRSVAIVSSVASRFAYDRPRRVGYLLETCRIQTGKLPRCYRMLHCDVIPCRRWI